MDNRLVQPFIQSTQSIIYAMTGIKVTSVSEPYIENDEFISYGVSSALTFSGKLKGRLVIDFTPEVAKDLLLGMTGDTMDSIKDNLFLAGISEMNNTIAGDAITLLNNSYSLSIRLAPPIVFTGKNVIVATSKTESVTYECATDAGKFKMNIAIQGGIAS